MGDALWSGMEGEWQWERKVGVRWPGDKTPTKINPAYDHDVNASRNKEQPTKYRAVSVTIYIYYRIVHELRWHAIPVPYFLGWIDIILPLLISAIIHRYIVALIQITMHIQLSENLHNTWSSASCNFYNEPGTTTTQVHYKTNIRCQSTFKAKPKSTFWAVLWRLQNLWRRVGLLAATFPMDGPVHEKPIPVDVWPHFFWMWSWPLNSVRPILRKHPTHMQINSKCHHLMFNGEKMATKVEFWS